MAGVEIGERVYTGVAPVSDFAGVENGDRRDACPTRSNRAVASGLSRAPSHSGHFV